MNTTSLALIHYAGWLTCDKGKDENSWSDRKHLPKGKITALQFKADSDWVCQVRARYVYLIDDCMVLIIRIRRIIFNFSRYGKQWASWRITGPESPNAKTYKVNFGEQDSIASIRGIWRKPEKESKDANMAGWIEQITLVTTSGVTHGPYGDEGAPVQGTNR